jgi:hypothetical protein
LGRRRGGEGCSSAQLAHFLIMMWIGLPEQELPGVVAALSSPLWHDVNLAAGERKKLAQPDL